MRNVLLILSLFFVHILLILEGLFIWKSIVMFLEPKFANHFYLQNFTSKAAEQVEYCTENTNSSAQNNVISAGRIAQFLGQLFVRECF